MDWKEIVCTVAPTVAGAFGTPAAGIAVKVLADAVLGGSSGDQAKDEAAVSDALAGGLTPELRAKLIDADTALKTQANELQKIALQNDVTRYTSDAADRDSARRNNVAGQQAARVFWFAVLIFVGVVGIEGAVLVLGLPKDTDSPELMGRILGTLDAALMASVYYIFGSSASSARKDEIQSTKGAK